MAYKRLALILGNQLFPDHSTLGINSETLVFMAEDEGLCKHFQYHKHKLILFLSAMRSHADQFEGNIAYWELKPTNQNISYEEKLEQTLDGNPSIDELVTYDIEDHFFDRRIKEFCKTKGIKLKIEQSPGFFTSREEFSQYNQSVKKPFMHTFYQRQRKKLDLLVDGSGEPLHGKWSFDEDNRKKLPKGIEVPVMPEFDSTDHTEAVKEIVDELFPDHPGRTENFQWATTRKQVLRALDVFISERFNLFGPYEDAIHSEHTFLFHSVLSPYINMGLITPHEVIDRMMKFADQNDVHYPSLEGFVRQIIGWREFMRGIYHEYDERLNENYFGHNRRLKPCWYDGTTGIPPLDDAISKAVKHGYTHHIERLMVVGNIMLLCEINPDDVYKWFMEMYVDSSDWVMAPNVYGMSQFADGGIFATKPYIGGSSYILKMSNYPKKGEWVDTVNGLYWRFIDRNRETFKSNPRMSMMVKMLDKMDQGKKDRIFGLAENLVDQITY
jgi:deoxyribodipyrimidine photolyase-related protein